jgi:hypothetical protein
VSEFFDHALNKKGEVISVGSLVRVWGENRRVREIRKTGQTFQLTLDNWTYARIDAVVLIPESPPVPQRFIRFQTTTGAIFFDLEQIVAVIQPSGEITRLLLHSGQAVDLNHTFKSDIVKIMDAWTAYQNDRWQKEQRKR